MSTPVEIVFFIACVAFILLVPFVMVTLYRIHQVTERILRITEEMSKEWKVLLQAIHGAVDKVHGLGLIAEGQLREVQQVINSVRDWTQRTDHFVREIGCVIGPPISAVKHKVNLWGMGLKVFFQTLLSRDGHNQPTQHESQQETYERK